jgi:hypothetical protein
VFEQPDPHSIGWRDRLKGRDMVSPLDLGGDPARCGSGGKGGSVEVFGDNATIVHCALAD